MTTEGSGTAETRVLVAMKVLSLKSRSPPPNKSSAPTQTPLKGK